MPERGLIVDGFDLSEIGFTLRSGYQDSRGTPRVEYPSVNVPGRGEVRTSNRADLGRRNLTIPGTVQAATFAQMHTWRDELAARLQPNVEHTFRTVDDETREFVGLVRKLAGDPVRPDQVIARTDVAISVALIEQPFIREVALTSNAFSAATAMDLGAMPVWPVVRINGAVTNPILVYRDDGGTEVARMEFTVTIGAGDWIEVDMEEKTIVDQASTSHPEYLTGGYFFQLDPGDGDYPTASWPTLEETNGASCTAEYHKLY